MGLLRWVIGFVFIVICTVFAISNRNLLDLHLWPTPYAFSVQTGLAILIPAFFAFVLGGIFVQFSKAKLWNRAKKAESRANDLELALHATEEKLQETEARLKAAEETDEAAGPAPTPQHPALPQPQNA